MRRYGAMVLLLALLAGCGVAQASATPALVLTRTLLLARGAGRPLPTTVWYPADLGGRHPIVLFSHGLGGLPANFAPLLSGWAAAGFVVAAPAYPHTNARVPLDRRDVARQPADAAYVLEQVKALDGAEGDVLAGHLDTGRVAAVGFSAGGTTTLGLLGPGHDPAIRAAVSIAGRRPPGPIGGSGASVLFLHGDRDRVVPIGAGQQAYAAVPWPAKRFVTVSGGGHGQYLSRGDRAYESASALILGFLRDQLGFRAFTES